MMSSIIHKHLLNTSRFGQSILKYYDNAYTSHKCQYKQIN